MSVAAWIAAVWLLVDVWIVLSLRHYKTPARPKPPPSPVWPMWDRAA